MNNNVISNHGLVNEFHFNVYIQSCYRSTWFVLYHYLSIKKSTWRASYKCDCCYCTGTQIVSCQNALMNTRKPLPTWEILLSDLHSNIMFESSILITSGFADVSTINSILSVLLIFFLLLLVQSHSSSKCCPYNIVNYDQIIISNYRVADRSSDTIYLPLYRPVDNPSILTILIRIFHTNSLGHWFYH